MSAHSKLLKAAVGLSVAAYLDAKHGIGADGRLGKAFVAASLK